MCTADVLCRPKVPPTPSINVTSSNVCGANNLKIEKTERALKSCTSIEKPNKIKHKNKLKHKRTIKSKKRC